MTSRLIAGACALGLSLAACQARQAPPKSDPADPWSGGSSQSEEGPSAAVLEAEAPALGDVSKMLSAISDSIEKPGPYEAPERSPGYSAGAPHWGILSLSGDFAELTSFSWRSGAATELRTVTDRLAELAGEEHLIGLVVRFDSLKLSIPDVAELAGAFARFRAAGKKLHCHSAGAENFVYLLATSCERIGLAPLGQVVIAGPALVPIHVHRLLDDLGITADFLHIGDYKGAAEPLTRDRPSSEMKETLSAILDREYQTLVAGIATGRKLPGDAVEKLIDRAMFTAEQALAAQLVDAVDSFDGFLVASTENAAWTQIPLEKPDDAMAALAKVTKFLGIVPASRPSSPHLAVVYAVGDIVDESQSGLLGAREEIAADTLVPALRVLAADDSVKAVVLRIDSGGGSAQASELIWRAVSEVSAKKPVVVSMSDVAASGGYYIAAGAKKIFALDDTLTGSIGVVGGKLAFAKALKKIGISTHPMGRGKRATMFASLEPWSSSEREVIRASMEDVYKTFVARVAAGRGKTAEAVHEIAQGRVWTGSRAKELGLVDEIGGLDAAIAAARELGKVPAGADLEIYPPTPTLRDVMVSFGRVHAPYGADAAVELAARAMSPDAAVVLTRVLRQVERFKTSRIQTVAFWPVLQQ